MTSSLSSAFPYSSPSPCHDPGTQLCWLSLNLFAFYGSHDSLFFLLSSCYFFYFYFLIFCLTSMRTHTYTCRTTFSLMLWRKPNKEVHCCYGVSDRTVQYVISITLDPKTGFYSIVSFAHSESRNSTTRFRIIRQTYDVSS